MKKIFRKMRTNKSSVCYLICNIELTDIIIETFLFQLIKDWTGIICSCGAY